MRSGGAGAFMSLYPKKRIFRPPADMVCEKRVTRGRDFIAEAEINASRARREAVSRRSSNWLHPAAPLCICPNIRVCHDVSICLAAGSEMARLDSRMSDGTGLLLMVREMKTLTLHGPKLFRNDMSCCQAEC